MSANIEKTAKENRINSIQGFGVSEFWKNTTPNETPAPKKIKTPHRKKHQHRENKKHHTRKNTSTSKKNQKHQHQHRTPVSISYLNENLRS
jgi:hypothetical protein